MDSESALVADGSAPSEANQAPDLSSLKQVRDILVGPLSTEIEQTVRELDQRLDRSMVEFSETTSKRVDAVEARFKGEFERLNGEVGSQNERSRDRIGQLEREMNSGLDDLRESLITLTGDLEKASESFRDELDKVREHVGQVVESVTTRLDDESRRLQDEMVDRSSLSAALSEVALRLAGSSGHLHDSDPDRPDIDLDHLLDG